LSQALQTERYCEEAEDKRVRSEEEREREQQQRGGESTEQKTHALRKPWRLRIR
jgi:hypothetical protein